WGRGGGGGGVVDRLEVCANILGHCRSGVPILARRSTGCRLARRVGGEGRGATSRRPRWRPGAARPFRARWPVTRRSRRAGHGGRGDTRRRDRCGTPCRAVG